MEYASGLVSTVFGLYSNMNPSNMSGVNDIIVVRDGNDVYKCSPFQIKFGKAHTFRIGRNIANIYINNVLSDTIMSVGSQGELYFEADANIDDCDAFFNIRTKEGNLYDEVSILEAFECSVGSQNTEMHIAEAEDQGLLYSKTFIENERNRNLQKRSFFKQLIYDMNNLPYQKLLSSGKYFDKLIDSEEYFRFLLNNVKCISHIMLGIWLNPIPDQLKTCGISKIGCCNSRFKFSLCG